MSSATSTDTDQDGGAVSNSRDRSLVASCVRDSAGLKALASDWSQLFKSCGCENVFLSFEWISGVHAQWGGREELFVIAVRTPLGRLVALAPFCITRSLAELNLRSVRFLSAPELAADQLTILVEPEWMGEAVAEIARCLLHYRQQWAFVNLQDTEAGSPPLQLLQSELSALGMWASAETACVCPYAVLPSDFDQYLDTIGSSIRYNFRRRLRKLQLQPNVDFISVQNGPELQLGFDQMVQLHQMRRDTLRTKSSFTTGNALAFHRSVLPQLASQGWVRLFMIRHNDVILAALYGFSIGRSFKFYQSGLHPDWSKFSLGLVLMGYSIKETIRCGHQEFDFLRGAERYKFHWAKYTRETITLRFFDSRPRSRAAAAAVSVRKQVSRLASVWRQLRDTWSSWRARPAGETAKAGGIKDSQ
jgi:CelD/BcsL family acetyltransferase involved in cellulose biosynthesis